MKVAVVGATGLVGTKILEVLAERNFPVTELLPVASAKSAGKKIAFKNKEYDVITPEQAIEMKPALALFSAGGNTSLHYAPLFAAVGTTVVDNSSAWRMDPNKKLIVPEVNAGALEVTDKIIANPNCSTIQMVVALKPLHDAYNIKRIVVSTYQSVTGTGKAAVDQLMQERNNLPVTMVYPHTIDLNVIPQVDIFLENDYTKEEMKMVLETQKIMGDSNIKVTATTVRIPVMGGHSEAVNVEFENEFEISKIKEILSKADGVILQDNPSEKIYPMPKYAHESDAVFVGRIRRDETQPRTLNMWIVSDNLRKGAATNAVQIAEVLLKNGWL